MSDAYEQLAETLGQSLAGLKLMKQTLEQEEEALRGRDPKAVDKTTRGKEVLAGGLNALSQRLDAQLRQHGLPSGLKGMARLLAALPAGDPRSEALRKCWRELVGLLNACRRLNEANGAYLNLLRQHTQRSLDILHDRSNVETIYGPDGLGRRPRASRKLLSV